MATTSWGPNGPGTPRVYASAASIRACLRRILKLMRVTVRLFAGLRELAGTGERDLELDSPSTVGDVWPSLGLGTEPQGLLYAVNREYAKRGRELAEGDEVALIPPVSGGSFRLSDEPLDLGAAVAEV